MTAAVTVKFYTLVAAAKTKTNLIKLKENKNMACRNAYKTRISEVENIAPVASTSIPEVAKNVGRLLFGADSATQASDLLQNNIDHFEWIVRNKIYPNFCGRYISGENRLTKEEIAFIHGKGCKIAAMYTCSDEKNTEEQGVIVAKKVNVCIAELGIPEGTAIFLEIGDNETANRDFMRGFAKALIAEGYTPGFIANTDAKFSFDREYSRGIQSDKEIFERCLIWAKAPTVKEYDGITTSHLIHPDNWMPFAPSGITRNAIAVWQYGTKCHPIEDDEGEMTMFNLDLVRNEKVIIEKMF